MQLHQATYWGSLSHSKPFETGMVLNQLTFIKTNQQTTGLHNTALQYLKELADNYIQIHNSKSIW